MKKIIILMLLISSVCFANYEKAMEYNKIGESYYHSKNYEKAEEFYLRAYQENSNNSQIASNLGLLYMRQEKMAKAIYWSEEARIGSNDNVVKANSLYIIGRVFEKKELYLIASKSYNEANQKNPNKTYEKALARMKDKFISKGIDLELAKDINKLGEDEYKAKNYKQAINEYLNSLKYNETDAQVWSNLALAYFRVDDFYNAQFSASTAITISEFIEESKGRLVRANTYYILGKLYEKNGGENTLNAYISYKRAYQNNPKRTYEEAIERLENKLNL